MRRSELWSPKISFHRSDDDSNDEKMENLAQGERIPCVISQYNINCLIPVDMEAICNASYVDWPFDIQSCAALLGYSDTNDTNIRVKKIELQTNLKHYSSSHRWKFLDTNVSIGPKKIIAEENYSTLSFSFQVQRNTRHHYVTFIDMFCSKFQQFLLI